MIYSVVPLNIIFSEKIEKPQYQEIEGGFVQLDNNNKISRLITTDLKLYLKYNPDDLFTKN